MTRIFNPLICFLLLLASTACNQRDQGPTGEVFVMTQPSDAVVEVNGNTLGTTPLQNSSIPTGQVLVTIRKEGYQTEWRSLTLATGERRVLELDLRPVKGLVLINSIPSGATVSLGEVFTGTTPLVLHDLRRGTHRARLVMTGFDDREIEFTVDDRIPQAVNVDMTSNSGTLIVHSTPPGATVFVDGRNEGVTPLSIDRIAQGARDISLQLPGHKPYRRNVVIQAADTSRVDIDLVPIPGSLRVVAIPRGSRVYINGEFEGEAPVDLEEIAPGTHTVRVSSRGHAEQTRTVEISRGRQLVEEFQLERNSGTLQIVTRPAGVNVNINGEYMGTTQPGSDASDVVSRPLLIDMLSQGSHTLQLVREGYNFENKRFFITKDEVTALDETLERKFIPNVLVRIGEGRDDVITGVLERRHPNGDLQLEIRKGVFRTLPAGTYLSIEPLKQEEELQ
ncbi:MAG: PEGA domain-containing protein [Opitutales bacterium]